MSALYTPNNQADKWRLLYKWGTIIIQTGDDYYTNGGRIIIQMGDVLLGLLLNTYTNGGRLLYKWGTYLPNSHQILL